MKVFIFKIIIAKLVLVSATPEEVPVESISNQTQNLWSELSQFSSDERSSRAISSFNRDNSYNDQCPGTVVTLSPGYATILKSHKGYGKVPYPSNYKVSKYRL